MRIAHVITGLDTGGAEMMLKKLISETRGTFEHVVISLKTNGPVGRSLQNLGVPVIALGGASRRASPALLFRLVKVLRTIEPDLVQGWMYHGNLAAWGAKIFLRAKWRLCWSIRCSFGEAGSVRFATRVIRNVSAWLSKPVHCIIYNSHLARHQHEQIGYPVGKGIVIPNGFDTERFHPNAQARRTFRQHHGIPETQLVVGHVARAQPIKDQSTLLSAAVEVARDMPGTLFVLAGSGIPALATTGNECVASIRTLGERIRLLPEQHDVHDVMAAFDVFVLSSVGEGFPNVLGEALSCGIPCVSTDVGDCAKIIGDAGIVVLPRAPDKLAAGIMKLLRLPEPERVELGLAARSRMQRNYSMANIAGIYSAVWRGSESADHEGAQCAA